MDNSNNKPLILISNDDGYFAPGLNALINSAQKHGNVVVVAPEQGSSGMSHAITIKVPLRASKIKGHHNFDFYKVNGTPADCIKLAINQLTPRMPDLIVSGINHGSNSSVSVLYSGTMGAALEGCLNGVPSIGFSLCTHNMDADFTLAEKIANNIIDKVIKNGLPKYTCLNVNIPVVDEQNLKGIKICRQAKGVWSEEFEKRTDPHGGTYYWLTGNFDIHENGSTDNDEWALRNNYASIVPVKIDFTDYQAIEFLNKLGF